eukprot:Skav212743  [mRNA]  locus=scaffold955:16752:17510:+ [translate_table: standard]
MSSHFDVVYLGFDPGSKFGDPAALRREDQVFADASTAASTAVLKTGRARDLNKLDAEMQLQVPEMKVPFSSPPFRIATSTRCSKYLSCKDTGRSLCLEELDEGRTSAKQLWVSEAVPETETVRLRPLHCKTLMLSWGHTPLCPDPFADLHHEDDGSGRQRWFFVKSSSDPNGALQICSNTNPPKYLTLVDSDTVTVRNILLAQSLTNWLVLVCASVTQLRTQVHRNVYFAVFGVNNIVTTQGGGGSFQKKGG